jgi:CRP/FNR family transcriptional regulator, cyclic AMP receptor protein
VIRKRDIDQLLAAVPLFSACSKKELVEIRRRSTTLNIPAGTVVARQGDRGQEFIVIVEGMATVAIDGKPVASLGPGDFFGEVALLDGGPRTATVTADSDLVAEVIAHRDFTGLLVEAPTVTRNILKGIAARLRAADARLMP